VGAALDAARAPGAARAIAAAHDWGALAGRMVEVMERRLAEVA